MDPGTLSVTVMDPDGGECVLHAHEELDGGDILPGFRCRVGRFLP